MLPVPGAPWPSVGSRAFGTRRSPTHVHQGVDLFRPLGSKCVACDDGEVVWALNQWRSGFSGYGKVVVLRTSTGPYVLYSHLDLVMVQKGQRVRKGEQVGTVGTTKFSRSDKTNHFAQSAPHVHFEVAPSRYPMRSEAARLDPTPFFVPGAPVRVTSPGSVAHEPKRRVFPIAILGGVSLFLVGQRIVRG